MKATHAAIVLGAAVLLAGATMLQVGAAEPSTPPIADPARVGDPAGDAAGGVGPDILGFTISQPEGPLVSFGVEFVTDPPLTWDLDAESTDMLMIAISTQADAELPDDADYVIGAHGANLAESADRGAHLYATDGSGDGLLWQVVDVAVDGTKLTLTVDRHLLGDPDIVQAIAHAATEGPETAAGADACPDSGALTYTLSPRG